MKNRTKTMSHTQLETLLNRLHLDHSKRSHVQEQYVRQKAGHYGESTADHYLQYLPQKHYLTIQDLRLFDGIHFFQIDAMVLCPEFILILEGKNYKGKLIFDLEHQQLFRKYNDQKDTFPDPFLQVEHQAIQLQRWLAQFNFPEIPIRSFIVVASPNTVIKTHGRDRQQFKNRIVRAKNIYHSVNKLHANFEKSILKMEQVKDLGNCLQKGNTPYRGRAILERFDLSVDDLVMGVQCAKCLQYPMVRKRDHWSCLRCGFKSGDAHLAALRDYQLLISNEISNHEFRKFTGMNSRKVVWKLLSEVCLQHSGQTKDRKYMLDFL